MVNQGIDVDPSQLRTHAKHVDRIADEVSKTSDAARTVSINDEAFGILISFVGDWFQDKEQDLAAKFSEAVTGLRSDAANLRQAAARYEGSDTAAANRTRRSGGRVLPL